MPKEIFGVVHRRENGLAYGRPPTPTGGSNNANAAESSEDLCSIVENRGITTKLQLGFLTSHLAIHHETLKKLLSGL